MVSVRALKAARSAAIWAQVGPAGGAVVVVVGPAVVVVPGSVVVVVGNGAQLARRWANTAFPTARLASS